MGNIKIKSKREKDIIFTDLMDDYCEIYGNDELFQYNEKSKTFVSKDEMKCVVDRIIDLAKE